MSECASLCRILHLLVKDREVRCLVSSLLFLALALLFLLFLREGIDHQELTVGWVPFGGQIGLILVWHENCTLEGLHDWNVNVGLVLLVATILRPGQVVPDRLDLLHLGLPGAVQSILRDQVELLAQCELRQRHHSWNFFSSRSDDLALFVFLFGRRLPARDLLDQVLGRIRRLRPS